MNTNPDILELAADWHVAGEAVAIATVVESLGSSPCPAGSRMVISGTGQMAGSVSGGCVEGAVIQAAQDVLAGDKKPVLLTFGVTNEQAWEVGLACGGTVKIFVEALA